MKHKEKCNEYLSSTTLVYFFMAHIETYQALVGKNVNSKFWFRLTILSIGGG